MKRFSEAGVRVVRGRERDWLVGKLRFATFRNGAGKLCEFPRTTGKPFPGKGTLHRDNY